jgi:hypothetical protein
MGASRVEPGIELALVCEHRAEFLVLMAVNWQALLLLPAMNSSNAAVQVGGYLLP